MTTPPHKHRRPPSDFKEALLLVADMLDLASRPVHLGELGEDIYWDSQRPTAAALAASLGRAAVELGEEFRERHTAVDWERIHKFYMHSFVHDVFDQECIWEDIHSALPEIVTDLNKLQETLRKENE